MNIGFDAKRAFLNRAGLGNYSRNTLMALQSAFPEHHYSLFTPKTDSTIFLCPPGIEKIEPGTAWWKILHAYWRSYKIAQIATHKKLDIYHGLSHELPIGIEKTGAKTVVTIHDLIFLRFPELYRAADRKIYLQKIQHAIGIADCILAISKQTRNDLIDFFNISPERIRVEHQSIGVQYFQNIEEEQLARVRRKYNLPPRFMLTVGTIESRKNLRSILETMLQHPINLPLVVVGKPTSYLDSLNKTIAKLRGRVVLLHHVSDNEMPVFYKMAEMMIYPSVFEGFGLPVAEAQACGCPVITSSISSMPEAGGEGAVYIYPHSTEEMAGAIAKISTDDYFRRELAQKGLENAERFRPEKYAKALMDIYTELI